MPFDPETFVPPAANIKVIGIGGGGGNAVNTMIRTNIEGVEFIAANTDVQALRFSLAETKIQIGKDLTKGLGAGADPDIGRDAMLEDRHAIGEALQGAHMVFITAGMGGGTGTGGAAIAAQIAREQGALTVGVVTKPFAFEGKRRRRHAEEGIERLKDSVDTLITIPNQRLLQVASPDLSMIDAFRMADNVLVNAVKGISDIINIPGTVNVDFADVKTVMSSMGMALMGIGESDGQNRAQEAARKAIQSPLLEDVDIEGATGILINITAGENVSLVEVNEACSIVQEAAHEDANIIFGAVIDEDIGQGLRVTVIATGFPLGDDLADTHHKSVRRSFNAPIDRTLNLSSPKIKEDELVLKQAPLFDDSSNIELGAESKSQPTIDDSFNTTKVVDEASNVSMSDTIDTSSVLSDQVEIKSDIPTESVRIEGASLATPDAESIEQGNEMDKKIDAALKIAEKLSLENNVEGEDDLDVPSFLKTDSSDLSLS